VLISTGVKYFLGATFIFGFLVNDSVLASSSDVSSIANAQETKTVPSRNGTLSICSALRVDIRDDSTLPNQLAAAKRCEFAGEFKSPNSTTSKTCSYRCRGYGALANFSWPIDKTCPPSFDGNFPGP
jgi:hypothetical protein